MYKSYEELFGIPDAGTSLTSETPESPVYRTDSSTRTTPSSDSERSASTSNPSSRNLVIIFSIVGAVTGLLVAVVVGILVVGCFRYVRFKFAKL